jgi:hypothetical protein
MKVQVKIFTHEVIVHSQIAMIEKVLERNIEFAVSLNQKEDRSNIRFDAEVKEITTIKNSLGYNVMVLEGQRWIST